MQILIARGLERGRGASDASHKRPDDADAVQVAEVFWVQAYYAKIT